MKTHKLFAGTVTIMLAFVALAFIPTGVAAAASEHGTCEDVTIPVALGAGQPANQHVAGTLCIPDEWAPGEPQLDMLVHGATYNRAYWDWPVDPAQYSYVERTLQNGRATFALDRLGAGQSSRPLGALMSNAIDAYTLHQVIQEFRNDYARITLVSHSLGSFVALEEASTYQDVDKLVITGLLHAQGPDFVYILASLHPAMLDPQFFGDIVDPAYLTTLPGIRSQRFYNNTADPAAIAYDEAHKDVVPATQIGDIFTLLKFLLPPPANSASHITVPTLVIAGEHDGLFCGLLLDCSSEAAVQANEAAYYTATPSLTTKVVPNTGHNLTLHPSAGASFNTINSWIETH